MAGALFFARRIAGGFLLAATAGGVVAAGCSEPFEDATPEVVGADDGGAPSAAGSSGDDAGVTSSLTGGGADGSDSTTNGGVGGTNLDGTAGAGGAFDVPDTLPPTIVSVRPADGAKGVAASSPIEIVFSEPMAKATTLAAYQSGSAGIKPNEVTFSWNGAGTVLTVTPNSALKYAEGNSAGFAAAMYDYFVSSAAKDEAGNALAAKYTVQFATLRRATQTLVATSPLSGGYVVKTDQEGPTEMYVGAVEAAETFRSFVTFNLQQLPEGIVQFESASFQMFQDAQSSTDRTPYEALGDLEVYALTYSARNRAAFDSLDALGIKPIAKFGTSAASGYKSVVVTPTLTLDYKSRSASQYGIKFHTALNTDGHHDIVYFSGVDKENPPLLVTTYLVP